MRAAHQVRPALPRRAGALAAPAWHGTALAPGLRDAMGRRLQWDFSDVRVHTGRDAAQAARAVHAHAFTVGADIGFAAGRFAPETPAGASLLAHELAHVVQQSRGGTAPAGSPEMEQAARAASATAVSGGSAPVGGAAAPGVARQDETEKLFGTRVPDVQWRPHIPLVPPLQLAPPKPPASSPAPSVQMSDLDPPSRPLFAPFLALPPLAEPKIGKSPGDPQTATPTAGLIPGNAQVQDPGDFGLTYTLQHPLHGPGGFGPGFGFAAGVANLGHDLGLELGMNAGVPGGTSTSGLFLPHIAWAPGDRSLNVGVFGSVGVLGGANPPGRGTASVQAGGTAIVERPVGDRQRPRWLPSLQLTGNYSRYAQVGDGFATNAGSLTPAFNLQRNFGYHQAADGTPSKTPANVLWGETAFNWTRGGRFGGPEGSNADALSGTANLGYQHNFRLDNGHLIVSPLVWAGAKFEDDRAGAGWKPQWSGNAGIGLGISLSPSNKKPE